MGFDCTSRNLKIAYNESDGVVFSTEVGQSCYVDRENAKQLIEIQKLLDSGVESEKTKELENIVNDGFSGFDKICDHPVRSFVENHFIDGLEIITQTDCNLRCKYCYANGGSYEYGRTFLDPQMISNYITTLVEQYVDNIKIIKFFGGEPLGNPVCIIKACECVERLVSLGKLKKMPSFGVVTNGTIYSEKLAEVFKRYGFYVTFSLDGWRKINDKQRVDRQNKGSHDKVVHNIQAYKNAGLPEKNMMIEVTYTQNHIDQKITPLELMQYVIDMIGIPKVMISPCISEGNLGISPEDMLQIYKDCFIATYNNLMEMGAYVDASTLSTIRRLSGTPSCDFICAVGHKNISLLPGGNIYPCHMFLTNDYCMGKFIDGSWVLDECKSVLNKLSKVDHITKADRCRQCWARNVCLFCPGMYSSLPDCFIFGSDSRCFRESLMERLLLITAAISQKPGSLDYLKIKLNEL